MEFGNWFVAKYVIVNWLIFERYLPHPIPPFSLKDLQRAMGAAVVDAFVTVQATKTSQRA